MLIMRGDSKTGSLLFLVVPLYISKPREAMRTTWEDAKSKILKFIKIRIILMTLVMRGEGITSKLVTYNEENVANERGG